MKFKHLIYLLLLSFIIACNDTSKNSESKTTSTQVVKDTIKKNTATNPTIVAPKYPKITQDNVISFLTDYGNENPETKVKIGTNHGDIFIELYQDTPLHRANFIYLVKQQYFDGTFFHRIVPDFIIQGGNSDNVKTSKKRIKIGSSYLIPAELTSGRKHTYGTISGAKEYRENPNKKSAPFEFFIFLGPDRQANHLNGNYTVFARVTQGMDVVEKIANLPRDKAEWPKQNVYITAEVVN